MSGRKFVAWALVAFVVLVLGVRTAILFAFGEIQTAIILWVAGLIITIGILLTLGRDEQK